MLSAKRQGSKINIQKLVAFLDINNEHVEKEIRKIIPFTITSKTNQSLVIKLAKEVKNFYIENFKMLKK